VQISASGIGVNAGRHFMIDSKAMRKVGDNEDLVGMVSIRNAVGAAISMEGRILVKLH